jgi:hypothetical protein
MMGRHIHYSEPVEFHKSMPGSTSIVIWKRDGYTPAISRTAKPDKPTKPKSRLARNVAVDDEKSASPPRLRKALQ